MKEKVLLIAGLLIACLTVCSQDDDYVKDPAIGIHFFFNDFKTASNIRTASLSSTLRDKTFGRFKDMSPGISLSYLQGLSTHFDFAANLAGSFLDYPMEGKTSTGDEAFLLEADASIHAKMFSDQYVIVPYLSAGAGISKFKGYYGAFIPLGIGLQFNFFDDAFLLINSQYRMKVSENTNYHFFYSLGIVGNIGVSKKKAALIPE